MLRRVFYNALKFVLPIEATLEPRSRLIVTGLRWDNRDVNPGNRKWRASGDMSRGKSCDPLA